MGKHSVSRCNVEIDGAPYTNFKNFKEHALEVRKMTKIMKGSVSFDTTPQYTFSLDVVKIKGDQMNWVDFVDGTVSVELEGAETVEYEEVSVLSVGEYTVDDENETVKTIEFGAERRAER